ncbi:MAG TPA: PEP-CTERM sorting domain-containing protein [Verrucomicrobiae bacterium]|jgi:hypothetical protein
MKTNAWIALATIIATIVSTPEKANASLIAYWDFNNYAGADTPPALSADFGSGSLLFSTFTGGGSDSQTGTSLNARNGSGAGNALAFVGSSHNGESLLIQIVGTGLSDFVVTYASRRTSTGFTTHQWAYSTDGSTFNDFATISFTADTVFELKTVDFSSISALDNQATVYFRDTISGATSTGNNRFDNFAIEAVPEPTTIALGIFAAGLVGFSGLRALRKKLKP